LFAGVVTVTPCRTGVVVGAGGVGAEFGVAANGLLPPPPQLTKVAVRKMGTQILLT
jgi:hypothetical protein